jgi:hypothetical protein
MKIKPPTDKEFDEAVRCHERELAMPVRLRSIEAWIKDLKASSDPDEIRNTSDVRRTKKGAEYVSQETDLDRTLEHIEAVRRLLKRGDFLLAISAMRDLESRVNAINMRVRRKGAAAKSKMDRDVKRAKACRAVPGWPKNRKNIISNVCKGVKYDTAYRSPASPCRDG